MSLEWYIGDKEPEYIECKASTETDEDDPPCSADTMLYLFSSMQYLICCLTFSISKPFRKPVTSNPLYLVSVILIAAWQTYVIFHLDPVTEE